MFAVIFVVEPKPERKSDYLDLARFLRPKLEAIDGFIENERFESKRDNGRLLSLSTWRDEKALVRWRTQAEHHHVQEKGRFEIFKDYHIWIAEFTYDSDPPAGLNLDEKRFDETRAGGAKAVTITELVPKEGNTLSASPDALAGNPVVSTDWLTPMYSKAFTIRASCCFSGFWRDAKSAESWTPKQPEAAKSSRHRRARIIRAYSMFDRDEAPQYYPDVKNPEATNDRR